MSRRNTKCEDGRVGQGLTTVSSNCPPGWRSPWPTARMNPSSLSSNSLLVKFRTTDWNLGRSTLKTDRMPPRIRLNGAGCGS